MWVLCGVFFFFQAEDGIRDKLVTGVQTCALPIYLLDVSNVTVCVVGVGSCDTSNQVTGLAGVNTFSGTGTTSLAGVVANKQGWFVTYPTGGERALSNPTLLGGTVFFTTFIPVNDICIASGNGNLYALFYLTGSAYSQATIGTSGGGDTVAKSISWG